MVLEVGVVAGHAPDAELDERLGQCLAGGDAVGQQPAVAERGVETVGEQYPAAVGGARDVGLVDVDPVARRPFPAGAVRGKGRAAIDEARRDQAGADRPTGGVDIGDRRLGEAGALLDAGGELGPVGGGEQDRERIARPGRAPASSDRLAKATPLSVRSRARSSAAAR